MLETGTIPSHEAHDVPPIFIKEPMNTFVVKNKAATLHCRAVHALTLRFKCNGPAGETSSVDLVDPMTGVRIVDASLNVTRDNVEEYFGKDKYKCECIAWSSIGEVRSQPATLDVACKN